MARGVIDATPRKEFGQPPVNTHELSQPEHSWSELPENLAPSAVNTATGLWDMVTHPQRTAETFVDAAQGGVDRIAPEEFTDFMDTYVSPRSPETRERQRQVSGALGQALKDRYGSLENIKRTMITDPVGIALDVAGIAAGGYGLLRGGLSVGSKARLAEIPGALNAERLAAKELGQTIAENNPGLGIGDKLSTIGKGENAQASKMVTIYNPIPKPQRSFKQDYAGNPLTDKAGKLLEDREGRTLIGKKVVGRQMIDGPDIPATPSDIRFVGEETLRKGIETIAPSEIRGNAGLATFDKKSGHLFQSKFPTN